MASKQREATGSVRTLSHVNKFYNVKINNHSFSDTLIDTFSRRFFCAHETITRNLATRAAFHRLQIQRPLKELSYSTKKVTSRLFNNTIDIKTINLEFTYTHNKEQKTALMISIDYPNNMYERLIENGAQINTCNALGWSALSLAAKTKYTDNLYRCVHFYKLIQQPEIKLDHQNFNGKSPLYILLFSLKKYRFYVTNNDIIMLKNLLKAGANPELANNKGITPINLADKIYNPIIIELLENAIANKRTKQDLMTINN